MLRAECRAGLLRLKAPSRPGEQPMNHTENTTVTTAIEAAEILARAIQRTPEWKAFQNARGAVERDAELQDLFTRYRRLAQSWRLAQQQGRGLAGKAAMDLPQLQSRIEANATYQLQQQAGSALVALLQKLNQAISAELGLDFAATAAPRRGGCCG